MSTNQHLITPPPSPVPVIPTEEQRLAANAITDENGKRWDRTMDAVLWAKAFCILYPNNDEANMLGWFANAIMSGWDHHAWLPAHALPVPQQEVE
jgi:hypothetical protein